MGDWKRCFLEEELADTEEIGFELEKRLEMFASVSVVDKYKSHNKDIEKISALVFCLSTRLSRVEREMIKKRNDDDGWNLEVKKEKLINQIEEAQYIESYVSK